MATVKAGYCDDCLMLEVEKKDKSTYHIYCKSGVQLDHEDTVGNVNPKPGADNKCTYKLTAV